MTLTLDEFHRLIEPDVASGISFSGALVDPSTLKAIFLVVAQKALIKAEHSFPKSEYVLQTRKRVDLALANHGLKTDESGIVRARRAFNLPKEAKTKEFANFAHARSLYQIEAIILEAIERLPEP